MAKKGQKDICRWLRRQRCKVFCGVVIFQVFVGNIDNDSTKSNLFDPPIVAQYIRIIPLVCRRACTLRMELVGCELNGKQLSVRHRGPLTLGDHQPSSGEPLQAAERKQSQSIWIDLRTGAVNNVSASTFVRVCVCRMLIQLHIIYV